jgi:hypothetical protein
MILPKDWIKQKNYKQSTYEEVVGNDNFQVPPRLLVLHNLGQVQ